MILEDPCTMTFLRFDTVPKKFPDYHHYFQRRRKTFWAPLGALINCLGAHFSVFCHIAIDFAISESTL